MQEEVGYQAILAKSKLRRMFQSWQAVQQQLLESRGQLSHVIEKVCSPKVADIISIWQALTKESIRLKRAAKTIEERCSIAQQQTAFKVKLELALFCETQNWATFNC